MIAYKYLTYTILLLFILPAVLMDSKDVKEPVYANRQEIESAESTARPVFVKLENDPVMELLGNNFDEIERVLGEPTEQGYSSWHGPHNYILYQSEKGFILFNSPEGLEDNIAISIIMGPGQEIYGARVGMHFSEIMAILGTPDEGPEPGLDGLYYMDYYLGEFKNQAPEIFISFSAVDIDGPTQDVFIKWEAFEYNQSEQLQATR